MSYDPHKVRIIARGGRDLTPRGEEDETGFEAALGALLADREVDVIAVNAGALDPVPVPGLQARVVITTTPDPGEPGASDTGAEVTWAMRDGPACEAEARAMLRVLELAVALAGEASRHIRIAWFRDREQAWAAS